jgi:hypothetical protein
MAIWAGVRATASWQASRNNEVETEGKIAALEHERSRALATRTWPEAECALKAFLPAASLLLEKKRKPPLTRDQRARARKMVEDLRHHINATIVEVHLEALRDGLKCASVHLEEASASARELFDFEHLQRLLKVLPSDTVAGDTGNLGLRPEDLVPELHWFKELYAAREEGFKLRASLLGMIRYVLCQKRTDLQYLRTDEPPQLAEWSSLAMPPSLLGEACTVFEQHIAEPIRQACKEQAARQGSRVYEDIGLLMQQWLGGQIPGITQDTAAQVPDGGASSLDGPDGSAWIDLVVVASFSTSLSFPSSLQRCSPGCLQMGPSMSTRSTSCGPWRLGASWLAPRSPWTSRLAWRLCGSMRVLPGTS